MSFLKLVSIKKIMQSNMVFVAFKEQKQCSHTSYLMKNTSVSEDADHIVFQMICKGDLFYD